MIIVWWGKERPMHAYDDWCQKVGEGGSGRDLRLPPVRGKQFEEELEH